MIDHILCSAYHIEEVFIMTLFLVGEGESMRSAICFSH